jgi:hypothetical protein
MYSKGITRGEVASSYLVGGGRQIESSGLKTILLLTCRGLETLPAVAAAFRLLCFSAFHQQQDLPIP